MIRSALIALALTCSAAFAEEDGGVPRSPIYSGVEQQTAGKQPQDTSIEKFRTPVEALTERMIGAASKSVRFDWRKSAVQFGLIGSELLERNNFGSMRFGGMVRKPLGSFMGEVAISHVWTWGTDSSEKLALTPYRQYGRPSRFELDVNVSYPLAEGVVTSVPGFFPATELVFSAIAGVRYLFYPGGLGGGKFIDTAKAVLAPSLSDRELARMEGIREPGMKIDPGRYGLMGGLSLDVYLQPGLFISPRAMIAVPLLAPVTGTGLGLWWELTFGLGWAI
ncbi:MAG: hypothetical protein ACJ790_10735 [Myxococcaceae bacterium]